jgi:hypothetical protein
MSALGRLVSPANRDPSFGAVQDDEVSAPETAPAPPPAAEAATAKPAGTVEPGLAVDPTAAPAHVSEQPELVDSYADPGAEDGPGATVHVVEPWKGYGHMTADDVVARLAAASREELVAVELYERLNRGRRTVLTAARRQLRRAPAVSERR